MQDLWHNLHLFSVCNISGEGYHYTIKHCVLRQASKKKIRQDMFSKDALLIQNITLKIYYLVVILLCQVSTRKSKLTRISTPLLHATHSFYSNLYRGLFGGHVNGLIKTCIIHLKVRLSMRKCLFTFILFLRQSWKIVEYIINISRWNNTLGT